MLFKEIFETLDAEIARLCAIRDIVRSLSDAPTKVEIQHAHPEIEQEQITVTILPPVKRRTSGRRGRRWTPEPKALAGPPVGASVMVVPARAAKPALTNGEQSALPATQDDTFGARVRAAERLTRSEEGRA